MRAFLCFRLWCASLLPIPEIASEYQCQQKVKAVYQPVDLFMERAVRECKSPSTYSEGEADDHGEIVMEMSEELKSSRSVKRAKISKLKWYKLYKTYFAPGIQRGMGLDTYEPSTAIHLARASNIKGTLQAEDAKVLGSFSKSMGCWSSHVACELHGGMLRVTALAVDVKNLRQLEMLAGLTELQALALNLPSTLQLTTKVLQTLHWPQLRIMELTAPGPIDQMREQLFGSVLGRHLKLQVLTIGPGKYWEFDFSLSSYCNCQDLRHIRVPDMNIHEIPECFSQLRKLSFAYLPCNYLQGAPQALKSLPELGTIVAFRQGEYTPCHLQEKPQHKNLQNHKELQETHGKCKLVWETALGDDGDDNPRVLCPWVSIQGTLQDWLDLNLTKLEKLWLDGNFISGSIPETLPKSMPKLRSLDLYTNELSGAIPSSLAEQHFDKLQLHNNRLSGEVPMGLFQRSCCYFNIAANPDLTGCVPRGTFKDKAWARGIPGTKVTACKAGEL